MIGKFGVAKIDAHNKKAAANEVGLELAGGTRKCLLLEACGGRGDLKDVIASKADTGPTSILVEATYGTHAYAREKTIIRGIVLGLQQLLEHGITHRDFHGGNILFDKSGAVKIIDYGQSALTPLPPDGGGDAWALPFSPAAADEDEKKTFFLLASQAFTPPELSFGLRTGAKVCPVGVKNSLPPTYNSGHAWVLPEARGAKCMLAAMHTCPATPPTDLACNAGTANAAGGCALGTGAEVGTCRVAAVTNAKFKSCYESKTPLACPEGCVAIAAASDLAFGDGSSPLGGGTTGKAEIWTLGERIILAALCRFVVNERTCCVILGMGVLVLVCSRVSSLFIICPPTFYQERIYSRSSAGPTSPVQVLRAVRMHSPLQLDLRHHLRSLTAS
jgi:serine/threonine protein kinase